MLTLTATPIPRTLQLALTGVREMSLIATPPVDRLAVRTFISAVRRRHHPRGIQRERFRGGQVLLRRPAHRGHGPMASRLREIVPEARMIRAHGRLAPTDLERVMTEFGDGKFDILLSDQHRRERPRHARRPTPSIIQRADMFGLAQLYQLRGRVGRGKHRGYAYLTGRRASASAQPPRSASTSCRPSTP